ncbi:hypothetical protein CROQUDRAFT_43651 [Cronartium quercuum f. sp. fusiforme G11]|uniref:pectin lyase n=1 Tax=Cronartium quercuum f. sp. fusiforme G11 TaxID=708437 RepID=A0A9P6NMU9_9BASI|nr:hypothetical protein CROQUDRAFT_43651 [Cronartium quercuum f. sp. fusiforme G11]
MTFKKCALSLLCLGRLVTAQTGKPFGYGAGTTGGGTSAPQTPQNIHELKAWVEDAEPRVILIDRLFDFTDTEGNRTSKGCLPWGKCPNGAMTQEVIDMFDWCHKFGNTGNTLTISYRQAAQTPLKVGNDKTILGVGSHGVIRGKGFLITRGKNIIIQNIHITWLNPNLVWGGDAIAIQGGQNIWIDHCTFSLIGRMMMVLDVSPNRGITLSNNHFNGVTPWSNKCHNQHYWTLMITGPSDTVTVANNCFDSTSGRSPKVGGSGNPNVAVHFYNNLHTDSRGETFEIAVGGNILAEGNLFKNVKTLYKEQARTALGGRSFVPFTDQDAARCQSVIGRPCVTNKQIEDDGGAAPIEFGLDTTAVKALKDSPYIERINIKSSSSLMNGSPGGCGYGLRNREDIN